MRFGANILVPISLCLATTAGAANEKVDLSAVSRLLARELPLAVENRNYAALAPYFAEDVTLSTIVAQLEPISGRDGVLKVLKGLRDPTFRVDGVVASDHRLAIILNLPAGNELRRGSVVPIIDTYYLNPQGKIQSVERYFGSVGRRRIGS